MYQIHLRNKKMMSIIPGATIDIKVSSGKSGKFVNYQISSVSGMKMLKGSIGHRSDGTETFEMTGYQKTSTAGIKVQGGRVSTGKWNADISGKAEIVKEVSIAVKDFIKNWEQGKITESEQKPNDTTPISYSSNGMEELKSVAAAITNSNNNSNAAILGMLDAMSAVIAACKVAIVESSNHQAVNAEPSSIPSTTTELKQEQTPERTSKPEPVEPASEPKKVVDVVNVYNETNNIEMDDGVNFEEYNGSDVPW